MTNAIETFTRGDHKEFKTGNGFIMTVFVTKRGELVATSYQQFKHTRRTVAEIRFPFAGTLDEVDAETVDGIVALMFCE